MKTKCPCCRQRVDTALPIVDLNTNTLAFGEMKLRLSPQEAELMTLVLERFPGTVSYDTLIRRMWGTGEPREPKRAIAVLRANLCRFLRIAGFDIITTPCVGYRLEKAA